MNAGEFLDKKLIERILAKIREEAKYLGNVTLMEVCGSHTQAVERFGIRGILPKNVRLVSGPGCPVCITPTGVVDAAIKIADKGAIITTFGDVMRLPGSAGTLEEAKAMGADVRVVYSIADAVEIARRNEASGTDVVHIAIGFETTAPTTASVLLASPPSNFYIVNAHRWFPPAMEALLRGGEVRIDGFIDPGHVATVIGSDAFMFLSKKYGVAQVVSGFEPGDILLSVLVLLRMIRMGETGVVNEYERAVKKNGNAKSISALKKVFGKEHAEWRGLGKIPNSGMKLKGKFGRFDATKKFGVKVASSSGMPSGCSCSAVLRGKISPQKCPLFGKKCTPQKPVGPCMVSVEGACYNAYIA
ncbi:MAG: hydrogenase formation protein HypD [Candidatus Micrarchaeota archaeon]|nr:hydrogenase formation protein HypD [Candidatus Micrarchaeota archaeon]